MSTKSAEEPDKRYHQTLYVVGDGRKKVGFEDIHFIAFAVGASFLKPFGAGVRFLEVNCRCWREFTRLFIGQGDALNEWVDAMFCQSVAQLSSMSSPLESKSPQ